MSKPDIKSELKPISTFEEFVRFQGLLDWPLACEQHLEAESHFSSYTHSQQIYVCLRESAPFPSHAAQQLLEHVDHLWMRVKGHACVMSQAQDEVTTQN